MSVKTSNTKPEDLNQGDSIILEYDGKPIIVKLLEDPILEEDGTYSALIDLKPSDSGSMAPGNNCIIYGDTPYTKRNGNWTIEY